MKNFAQKYYPEIVYYLLALLSALVGSFVFLDILKFQLTSFKIFLWSAVVLVVDKILLAINTLITSEEIDLPPLKHMGIYILGVLCGFTIYAIIQVAQ